MTKHGRQERGDDKRGNSHDRRARKIWMLTCEKFGGNGTTVDCVHCGEPQTFETVEADRIIPGGSYRRENVQPSCRPDNMARSNKIDWVAPKACPVLVGAVA